MKIIKIYVRKDSKYNKEIISTKKIKLCLNKSKRSQMIKKCFYLIAPNHRNKD